MGGSSKASTTSASTQTSTTNTLADYSQGDGPRINTTVTGNGNTLTDHGAVMAGMEVAKDSLAAVTTTTKDSLNFGRDALQFANAQGAQATDVLKTSLSQVSGLAASNEAGNRDTVKTLSDLAMNLRSDGQAQTNKTVQTIVIALALSAAAVGAAVVWNKAA